MRRPASPFRLLRPLAFALALLTAACGHSQVAVHSGPPPEATAPAAIVEGVPGQPPAPPVGLPGTIAESPLPDAQTPAVQPGAPLAPHPVNAALLVPLSGPQSALGQELFQAAQLAVFELGDGHFTLLPFDTKGTPDGAAAAAQQAISAHADIILGPLLSAEVMAAGPVARAGNLPMIAFTTDHGALGNGIYSLGLLPGAQALRVVSYAQSRTLSRLAILAPGNDYGHAVASDVTAGAAAAGVMVTQSQFYDPGLADLATPIKALLPAGYSGGDPGFDALLLPDDGSRLPNLVAALKAQNLDLSHIKLLGTMLWLDTPANIQAAAPGSWFAAPTDSAHADFNARLAAAFGTKPDRLASLAYDATALAAILAKKSPIAYTTAALTDPSGFNGVDGLFRLRPDGSAERGYAILEIGLGGGTHVVDPAPASFSATPAE